MAPVAYPEPTESTVKQLYGQAFRCALPDCHRPLYRLNNDTGDRTLNSRVAHIHARRQGGPRWIEMSPEQNRGFDNLVLLCIEHAFEVDERPESFPADSMREWKQAQLDEYARIQQSWPINDEEAARVLGASEAAETLHAVSVIELVRRVEALSLATRRLRRGPLACAVAWQGLRERVRGSFFAHDRDGNRVYGEPSELEVRPLRAALRQALGDAVEELTPLGESARVELAAARETRPSLTPWCAAVDRAIGATLAASGRWPASADLDDDGQLEAALDALSSAMGALTQAWRGEPVEPPVEPAPPEPPPVDVDPLADHRALLNEARPFSRVDHRAYDPYLRARVADATGTAAHIPSIVSYVAIDLSVTAQLAAAVAGNADEDEHLRLIGDDRTRTPICAAVALLEATAHRAETRGLDAVAATARSAIVDLWTSSDWSDASTWDGNETSGRSMFHAFARATTEDEVRARLAAALTESPSLLPTLVESCAGWVEQYSSIDFARLTSVRRTYKGTPQWLPVDVIRSVAASTMPGVTAATEDSWDDGDSVESLVAELLAVQ